MLAWIHQFQLPLIKSFHLLGIIAWLAGIFYLPRILVHYVEGAAASEDVRRLLIMGQRLARFMDIMAMVAIALGLWMMLGYGDSGRWLMWKLVFVVLLIFYHGFLRVLLGRAQRAATLPSGRTLRLINEGALLIVLPILILAVVKPI